MGRGIYIYRYPWIRIDPEPFWHFGSYIAFEVVTLKH